MAVILDGKKLRDKLLDELHFRTAKFDKKPKLVVILVGDNANSPKKQELTLKLSTTRQKFKRMNF